MKIRLASRGSALALAQVDDVIARLSGCEPEIVVISSLGDRRQDAPIGELSGQGWFTSDIEAALGDGRADAAVHSAKDLPLQLAPGMDLPAFLPRADCRDALVTRDGATLDELQLGAVVGTSSVRRGSWIRAFRDDLQIQPIRGNVDTRLNKLDSGEVDALLLAAAGLDRLGRGDRAVQRLDPAEFPPAPAQGVIAVETRDAGEHREAVSAIDDADARCALVAERAVLEGLGGGCLLPLGAWAEVHGDGITLHAAFGTGTDVKRVQLSGGIDEARDLGLRAAGMLR
jgi:hydroxymethylbilane synthase